MLLKKIISALYILIVVCMGLATVIEKSRGTEFVCENIYGAGWFSALWAVLAAVAVVYFVRCRVRSFAIVALHLSFVIILVGALLTHVTAERGVIHLRRGIATSVYLVQDGDSIQERLLPFRIRLDAFRIKYHEGTDSPADYVSHITVATADGMEHKEVVSMNNICSYSGVRLYQNDYDPDLRGSVLSLNSDPWGIPVTYFGYALLFISLIWMLVDPRGTFRRLLASPLLRKTTVVAVFLFLGFSAGSHAARVLPRSVAGEFGKLCVLHNGRICPVQTLAIDFTKKLYGRVSYNGYTAEQVFTGFLFFPKEWYEEPVIKVDGKALRDRLKLPDCCSVSAFFRPETGGYVLGPYLSGMSMDGHDGFHDEVADIDDRLMLVMELRRGALLKVFPITANGRTTWWSPADDVAQGDSLCRMYMRGVFQLLGEEISAGNYDKVSDIIKKMRRYQNVNGGKSMPARVQEMAERIYNDVPFATILFMLNLSMGFLTLFMEILLMTGKVRYGTCHGRSERIFLHLPVAVMLISFAALTVCEALRWIVSGTIPMNNGYETMLFVAWTVMLLAVIASLKFRIALTFGFIMSGFFLLVSHISQMDPDITHRMPVLNSPLLSVHVSIIMIAFALLALTFICGVTALVIYVVMGKGNKGNSSCLQENMASLQLLSSLFLYPAVSALGIGIFVGAVWANVSWGEYWGWDPKEVWALITLMIYAIALHKGSLPVLRQPLVWHLFMTVAFLTVVMTYFGVNYILGGMHSYA